MWDFNAFIEHNLDRLVETESRLWIDEREIGVRFPAGIRNFSLHHSVQTVSGVHAHFYPTGTGGSFL
jgi:hypothetical protein